MSYDQQKLLRFQESVLKDADEKIARMNRNISKYEQRELENAKQQQLDIIFTYMQNRVQSLKSEYAHKVTKRSLELKKEILSFRNGLVEKIVQQCKSEILHFVNSDKYKSYLLDGVKNAIDKFSIVGAKIALRKEDMKFKDELLKISELSEIISDNKNKLGGFKLIAPRRGIMVDKTIETILAEQVRSFSKTDGLRIKNG